MIRRASKRERERVREGGQKNPIQPQTHTRTHTHSRSVRRNFRRSKVSCVIAVAKPLSWHWLNHWRNLRDRLSRSSLPKIWALLAHSKTKIYVTPLSSSSSTVFHFSSLFSLCYLFHFSSFFPLLSVSLSLSLPSLSLSPSRRRSAHWAKPLSLHKQNLCYSTN